MKLLPILTLALLPATLHSQSGGPLTPPGAPGVVYKTLQEVEPRTAVIDGNPGVEIDSNGTVTIDQPGSYYLVGDIATTTTNASGIEIESSYVSLNLNGFRVISPGQDSSARGIEVRNTSSTLEGISIKNGFIVNFGRGLNIIDVNHSQFTNLHLLQQGSRAVRVDSLLSSSDGNLFSKCHLSGEFEISVSLTGTSVRNTTIEKCSVAKGASNGLDISAQGGAQVTNTVVRECQFSDLSSDGCKLSASGSDSIISGTVFEDCSFADCNYGINGSGNSSGIVNQLTVKGCNAVNISQDALQLTEVNNSLIQNNSLSSGITMFNCSSGRVVENSITTNSVGVSLSTCSGLRLQKNDISSSRSGLSMQSSNSCRIEENHLTWIGTTETSSAISLPTTSQNCLIVRNSFSGYPGGPGLFGTSGSTVGPVVPLAGELDDTHPKNHPWANFLF